jgi:hypothetical protein
VLSGIVISATKEALFVQSGAFGGLVAIEVAVISGVVVEVADASAGGVSVGVTFVTGAAIVSVAGTDVAVAPCV